MTHEYIKVSDTQLKVVFGNQFFLLKTSLKTLWLFLVMF